MPIVFSGNFHAPYGHTVYSVPVEGLVPDGVVEPASIRVLVGLRRRYGPELDGDPLAAALDPGDGLIA